MKALHSDSLEMQKCMHTLVVWAWTIMILFTEQSLVYIQSVAAAALQHQHVCLTQDIKAVIQRSWLWSVGLFRTKHPPQSNNKPDKLAWAGDALFISSFPQFSVCVWVCVCVCVRACMLLMLRHYLKKRKNKIRFCGVKTELISCKLFN